MAEKTNAQLLAEITQFITDNGNKEITASQLRSILTNLVESKFNTIDHVELLGLRALDPSRDYGAEAFVYDGSIYISENGHLAGENPENPGTATFINLGSASTGAVDGTRAITRPGDFYGIVPGGTTTAEVVNNLLWPAENPGLSVGGGVTIEFGADPAKTMSYTITKKTYGITQALVTKSGGAGTIPTINIGPSINSDLDPYGSTQSGVVNVTVDTPNLTPAITQVTTYTITVHDSDGRQVAKSTSYTYNHRRYWGNIAENGSGIPYTSLQDIINNPPTDAAILGLSSELATSRVKTLNSFNGQGNFLTFAWPALFGDPSILVNNLPNNAFTKVRAATNFVNQFGYVVPINVYVSNTQYNSPVNLTIL